MDRPLQFSVNHGHPLAQGLVFAGLGRHPNSTYYHDSSHYCGHGTLTDMAVPATATSGWTWDAYLGRWVLSLDGTNDYVGGLTALGQPQVFSLAAWAYLSDASQPDGRDRLMTWCESPGSAARDRSLGYEVSSGKFVAYAYDGAAQTAYSPAQTRWGWHHIACTLGDGFLRAWLNGVSGTAVACSGAYAGYSSPEVTLGYSALGNWYPALADAMIFSRVLTDAEISTLADPSNTMLSGMLQYKRRRSFGFFAAAAGGFKPALAARRQRAVGTGVI